jgi:hypothetical protein
MKTKYLIGLVLLVTACSGGQTTSGDKGGQSQAQLKKAAAEAHSKGSDGGADVCVTHGWYGDGECDTFCQDADSGDCGVNGTVCAAFIEEPNGLCSRKPNDPCIGQDPDCGVTTHPHDPGDDPTTPPHPTPGDPTKPPVACPTVISEPDGVCEPFDATNPCAYYEDGDCVANGGGGDETPPDQGPPSCKAVPEPSDGVCNREPTDPCIAADPDCVVPVACAAYIEQSDGECKREPSDPCIFQDPDCHLK